MPALGFSRPSGREWIETSTKTPTLTLTHVSPVLVGGSGLKPARADRVVHAASFSRPSGREWIETLVRRTGCSGRKFLPS